MQTIAALNPETTTGKSKEMFGMIQTKLGMVPNMMRTMGNSPAVLNAYMSFNEAIGKSSIGAELGELISITVANANKCGYCSAAHSFIAEKLAGVDTISIKAARMGKSSDTKVQAALTFVGLIIDKKGAVSSADVEALKKAGYTDAAVTEIIAYTGFNIFTNYFNNALNVALDFPSEN